MALKPHTYLEPLVVPLFFLVMVGQLLAKSKTLILMKHDAVSVQPVVVLVVVTKYRVSTAAVAVTVAVVVELNPVEGDQA